jgi:hypothetical protein
VRNVIQPPRPAIPTIAMARLERLRRTRPQPLHFDDTPPAAA